MRLHLFSREFYTNYIVHPRSKELTREEKRKATIAAIAFGILTFGIYQLFSAVKYRENRVKLGAEAQASGSTQEEPSVTEEEPSVRRKYTKFAGKWDSVKHHPDAIGDFLIKACKGLPQVEYFRLLKQLDFPNPNEVEEVSVQLTESSEPFSGKVRQRKTYAEYLSCLKKDKNSEAKLKPILTEACIELPSKEFLSLFKELHLYDNSGHLSRTVFHENGKPISEDFIRHLYYLLEVNPDILPWESLNPGEINVPKKDLTVLGVLAGRAKGAGLGLPPALMEAMNFHSGVTLASRSIQHRPLETNTRELITFFRKHPSKNGFDAPHDFDTNTFFGLLALLRCNLHMGRNGDLSLLELYFKRRGAEKYADEFTQLLVTLWLESDPQFFEETKYSDDMLACILQALPDKLNNAKFKEELAALHRFLPRLQQLKRDLQNAQNDGLTLLSNFLESMSDAEKTEEYYKLLMKILLEESNPQSLKLPNYKDEMLKLILESLPENLKTDERFNNVLRRIEPEMKWFKEIPKPVAVDTDPEMVMQKLLKDPTFLDIPDELLGSAHFMDQLMDQIGLGKFLYFLNRSPLYEDEQYILKVIQKYPESVKTLNYTKFKTKALFVQAVRANPRQLHLNYPLLVRFWGANYKEHPEYVELRALLKQD